MRKSNSKETRRAVEAYVLETIEDYTDRDEPETARPVSRFYDILKDEMSFQSYRNGDREILGAGLAKKYHSAGRYGFVTATRPYWVWYLAVFQGEFIGYTSDAYDNIKTWLDETEEEAERYNADQAWHMYAHLTASAFERLYDRENTPHRIPTSEFKSILQQHGPSYFFDRANMRYHKQTMRDITVTGFYIVEAYDGTHDCYKVESMQASDPESPRHLVTYFFDRESMRLVFPKEA